MKKRYYNNKKKIIVFSLILTITLLLPLAYSAYQSKINVSNETTVGKLRYDVSVDSKESYVENNIPFFYISVKNADSTGITDSDFDYSIKLTNKSSSNGLYKYIDDSGNDSGDYASSLDITGSLDNKVTKTVKYKVYVKASTNLKTVVNYDINYDVVQKKMD